MKNELSCLRVEKQSVTVQRKQENWKLGILNNKSWKEINQLIDRSNQVANILEERRGGRERVNFDGQYNCNHGDYCSLP